MVKVITGVEGGTDEHWFEIIGPVHQLPIIDNVRSNWAVVPGGKPRERTVIARAAEIIRQAHPYVRGSEPLTSPLRARRGHRHSERN